MKFAQIGNRVAVHYIGTLDNGRIFDSRDDDAPLIVTLGNNEIFPALEAEIIGMKEGEVKNILIAAKDAYGERLDGNIFKVKRSTFPPDKELKVGQKLNLEFADGETRIMMIIKIENDIITLDGNHSLAGLDLTFALKLAEILPSK